ncbi:MAG: S-layer homology domain-containing protein, partial [Butyricicoccus sp.]|nr:S-layer homology domain-containing protein [Butyricicoccus sp.]
GYGNGLFGPNDVLTREQLAVMLYQYAAGRGWDVEPGEALDASDAHTVSFWAQDAVRWAVQNGVLTENAAGSLAVAAPASRADVAQAFMTLVLRYA